MIYLKEFLKGTDTLSDLKKAANLLKAPPLKNFYSKEEVECGSLSTFIWSTLNARATAKNPDKVLLMEAYAISVLSDLLDELLEAAEKYQDSLKETLKNFVGLTDNHNSTMSFHVRLEGLKKAFDNLKNEPFQKPEKQCFDQLRICLGWLTGDDLEHAFLLENDLPSFNEMRAYNNPHPNRIFHDSILDKLIFTARIGTDKDKAQRSEKAKALWQLNTALNELVDHIPKYKSRPTIHKRLNEILDSFKNHGQTFDQRVKGLKSAIEEQSTRDLIARDKKLGRIFKEIGLAILMIGFGYAIAKAIDVYKNKNPVKSCVFFKDANLKKLDKINSHISSITCK